MLNLKPETTESIVSFVTGDTLATIMAFVLFKDVALPMILAVATGILGGFFALLGKDLYKWCRDKYLNRNKNKKK